MAAWRASGMTAEVFSARRGWSPHTLRWWSSRLGRETSAAPVVHVRMAQLVRPAAGGGGTDKTGSVVVELLQMRVRITVESGADRETVVTVLKTLAERVDR